LIDHIGLFYWSAIVTIALCFVSFSSDYTLGNIVTLKSTLGSQVIQIGIIRKLGYGFFLFAFYTAVSLAVCEICSVKEWRNLENQVTGRSRSLKMVPFDRTYATFYWSAIVIMALSCIIFELFDIK